MRCNTRSLVAALIVCIFTGFAAAACGQPQSSSPTLDSDSAPGATSTFTLLQSINARLAAHGEATLPPSTDPSQGVPFDKTAAAAVDATYAAITPPPHSALSCGPTADRDGDLVNKYGPVSDECSVYGTKLVVTTWGDYQTDTPGILAVYDCGSSDAACVRGQEPSNPGSWKVFVSPTGEGVTIRGQRGDLLLILPGEYCFDIANLSWIDPCNWDSTPTPAVAHPTAAR